MCSIFGLLDYKGNLSPAERLRIIKILSTAAEIRGIDATGIAYVQGDDIQIQKAPRPAHEMRYRITPEARYIMGHTRMTTQGSEKKNQNNHPFPGKVGGMPFALAHNGVLYNDYELRRTRRLPSTKIETDSYVAVQLIERQHELSPKSLKQMAEALHGSFTITVLDVENNLYLVKGNNPLAIYLFPQRGFYLYASTAEILDMALKALGMSKAFHANIKISQGEIMKIDTDGNRTVSKFDDAALWMYDYCGRPYWTSPVSSRKRFNEDSYMDEVIQYGLSRGVPESELNLLIDAGYDAFDIEELLFDPELRQCCIDEINSDQMCELICH